MIRTTIAYAACLLFAAGLGGAPAAAGQHGKVMWKRGMAPWQFGPARGRTAGATPGRTQSYNFTFFDYPMSSYTFAGVINPAATAHAKRFSVGQYAPAGSQNTSNAMMVTLQSKKGAFVESFRQLLPGMQNVTAFGVNDSGAVVGTFRSGTYHGYLLKGGNTTQIDAPYNNVTGTSANDINNAGTVVGAWFDGGPEVTHGFTWRAGKFTQVTDYPGATDVWPWSINSAGDLSGYLSDSAGVTHGFLLHNGVYTLIDPPGSVYTIGEGVNDSGVVVGSYCLTIAACEEPVNGIHAFVYSGGSYTIVDIPMALETDVESIDNAGVLAGAYMDSNGFDHSFLITP